MAFSGGVYTLPGPALVTGEIVSATENNQLRNDMAASFNLTMLRNGTSTATANLPMGGYKLTGLGAATTNGDALSYGAAAVVTTLTSTSLTATRVPYATTGGLLTDSANMTFNGTTLTAAGFAGPLTGNVTGDVSGNAGTVTNGVYTVGDQTIGGTKTFSSNPILSGGTANGVAYLNGSKVLTTGSALTFDGTTLMVGAYANSGGLGEKLTINGNGLITQLSNQTNRSQFGSFGGSTTIVGSFDSMPIEFRVANTEQMRLTSTGLGIGTSSPAQKLHINSSGTSAYAEIQASTGIGYIGIDTIGMALITPSAIPMYFSVNGAERMRLDTSGNLGLGVTPSAWSSFKAIQLQGGSIYSGATNDMRMNSNAYWNGSNWIYVNNTYATQYYQNNGLHAWFTAPSGTAGNAISFTQAMTLTAGGDLLVGTTSAAYGPSGGRGVIEVYGSTNSLIALRNATANAYLQSFGNDLYVNNGGNGIVSFNNNGSERMRIDSSGNLLVGTTSTVGSAKQTISTYGNNLTALTVQNDGLTQTGAVFVKFYWNAGQLGSITGNGSTTSYNTSSDYRLKENIQPMQGALDVVAQLNPVTYTWKADGSDGQGFIAHELQAVVPDCVTGEKDAVDAEGKPVYQGVDTSFLVGILTKAIQELKAELDATKAEVAALKGA